MGQDRKAVVRARVNVQVSERQWWSDTQARQKKKKKMWIFTLSLNVAMILPHLCFCLNRDNILVLDIFFEALNYETIEQKKAYEVAGLLGAATCCCVYSV